MPDPFNKKEQMIAYQYTIPTGHFFPDGIGLYKSDNAGYKVSLNGLMTVKIINYKLSCKFYYLCGHQILTPWKSLDQCEKQHPPPESSKHQLRESFRDDWSFISPVQMPKRVESKRCIEATLVACVGSIPHCILSLPIWESNKIPFKWQITILAFSVHRCISESISDFS